MLGAVAAIHRAGLELAGTLDLHLVADEEHAGIHGTKVLLEEGLVDQDAAVVGEPTELEIALAERGRMGDGRRPRQGCARLHAASRRERDRLDGAVRASATRGPPGPRPLGPPTVNVALVAGGSAPNVVPDRCEVEIDRRIVPGEDDPDEVVEPFRRLVEKVAAEDPDVDIEIS